MKIKGCHPYQALRRCSLLLAGSSLLLGASTAVNAADRDGIPGVDLERKVLYVGALNAMTGPAAPVGIPFAHGKRLLAANVNSGRSGLLPPGWRMEMVEVDHSFDVNKAIPAYNKIKDDVFVIGTSFGTPTTLVLRPLLNRNKTVAFPASLSTRIAGFQYTPPLGTTNRHEAMRAMDWAVETAKDSVRAGIIYQKDDYGLDTLDGWREAAALRNSRIQVEHAYVPGQQDFTKTVAALKAGNVTHVMLATLPTATAPIMITAEKMGYRPIWLGNTPSWSDSFFDRQTIPDVQLQNFHWVNGLPVWGEDAPFMADFLAVHNEFGAEIGAPAPDFYMMLSYLQGMAMLEIFKNTIESGNISREEYLKQLHALRDFDVYGALPEPIDLSVFPYESSTQARVLHPAAQGKRWMIAGDYQMPSPVVAERKLSQNSRAVATAEID